MSAQLRKPSERTCERCGREEVWSEAAATWRVRRDEEDRPVAIGSRSCIHEWDIDGAFDPVVEGAGGAGSA
jgi:hypothetical protein